jgi:hypothetical protein
MSDLTMDETNEGHSGTEIQAQTDFNQDYVFQGNGQTAGGKTIDGLRGIAGGEGTGVRGEGVWVGVSGGALDNFPPPMIGVDGTGQTGVRGIGGETGVLGTGESAGVEGTAASVRGAGVLGTNNHGTGVLDGPGVHGMSRHAIGVLGESTEDGYGVLGHSLGNRGGVFQSDRVAQLRLIPTDTGVVPLGQVGDLYLYIGGASGNRGAASLIVCVRQPPSGPAEWQQIQLTGLFHSGDPLP